jgi:diacylglycerol kinase (ATP)
VHGSIYEFDTLPYFVQPRSRSTPGAAGHARGERAVPLVGIIRNPRSHRNKGNPAELEECANILTETPVTREALRESLIEFARRDIDYLVVDGGDGTVRDVLSCGADIFAADWPAFIILAKGKTNALTVDLGVPRDWSLTEAIAAARRGRSVIRRPLRVSPATGQGGCVQGFFLGAGVFTLAVKAGQEAHRRGAFNSVAVAVTTLWTMMQALFGRAGNPWRACSPMRLRFRKSGKTLPHGERGNPDERFLMVATTFEKFPLGARPFGRDVRPGLKLGTIDWPVRWLVALLPLILFGFMPRFFERAGIRRLHADGVELDLGAAFIVDGEAFPPGRYLLEEGPQLTFIVP